MTLSEALMCTGITGVFLTILLTGIFGFISGDRHRAAPVVGFIAILTGIATVGCFLASIWTQVG